jgi:hypothetical protein
LISEFHTNRQREIGSKSSKNLSDEFTLAVNVRQLREDVHDESNTRGSHNLFVFELLDKLKHVVKVLFDKVFEFRLEIFLLTLDPFIYDTLYTNVFLVEEDHTHTRDGSWRSVL